MGSTKSRLESRARGRIAGAQKLTADETERETARLRFAAAQAQREAAKSEMAVQFGRLEELTGSRESAAEVAGITPQEADSLLGGGVQL